MYRAFGLLHPTSDFTLDEAVKRLSAALPAFTISRAGEQLTVASEDWGMELLLNSEPYVQAESVGFAEKIAGWDDGAYMEACNRRVEIWSDTPDYEMAHFNDFQVIIEVLKTFAGIVAIDPKEPCLL